MSAKHFLDDPLRAVLTSLRSLTLTNPSLRFDESNKIVYRHPDSITNPHDVSVISGGGSGHEPGFSGFVGDGLLTACVCGTIFASPSAAQIQKCLMERIPTESQGTLLIVTNYTGDVLNFGVAAEKAKIAGKQVAMVIVGDDVGVGRARGGKVGRRGLSGTALVVKICGALAKTGASLDECARIGNLVVENLVSLGASLSRVHAPGKDIEEVKIEEERLGPGLVEIGMGVHNEPGCEKVKTDLPGLIQKMLAQMIDFEDKDRAYVKIEKSDKTVILVNNFGGVSNLEFGAIITEVILQLQRDYGLKPKRLIAGTIFGSLNGPGFGLSLLKLVDTGLGPGKSLLELLDASVEATGWPANIKTNTWEKNLADARQIKVVSDSEVKPIEHKVVERALKYGLERVINAEADVTRFDTVVGDGDCGIGLKRGADAILQLLERTGLSNDAVTSLAKITQVVETNMDGTSGALYAIFLNLLTHNLRHQDTSFTTAVTSQTWAKALRLSMEALSKYTPAQPGDRTLLDALSPFINVLQRTGKVKEAAAAAKTGAEKTKGMKATLGRSVYVGGEGYEEVPDPGAYGLSEFLIGLSEGL